MLVFLCDTDTVKCITVSFWTDIFYICILLFTLTENQHSWVNNGSHMYWGNFQVSDSKSISVDISFLFADATGKQGDETILLSNLTQDYFLM